MGVIYLHDKSRIEAFLRTDVYLHIYSIGDLDDFFWPDTTWYGWEERGEIQAVALLYTASPVPTLLALSDQQDVIWELVRSIFNVLPERFEAHLSPRVAEAVEQDTSCTDKKSVEEIEIILKKCEYCARPPPVCLTLRGWASLGLFRRSRTSQCMN